MSRPSQQHSSKTERSASAHARLDGNVARRVVADREFLWWDTELPGFGLRTFAGGSKCWFIQFRQRGKQKRVVLGRPGEMSAAQARTAARAHLINAALDGLPKAGKAVHKRSNAVRFRDYRPEGSNPCTFIKPNKRRKCERFLSDQEVSRLGEVLDRRRTTQPLYAIIIYLLLLTGCPRSEITGLTWSEVTGGRLLLHDSKTGPRTVWLGDEARLLLSTPATRAI